LKLSRVQEILRSKENIEVKLKGNPIWIDSLDERNETVKIHMENNPEISQEVEITLINE
jgi:small acid-soluble spore protein H (minor)